MAEQRSRLTMDILTRVRGIGDVDRLARAVDDTGKEMSEAARDAKQLDRAINDVSDELRQLNAELLRTGDIDAFEKAKGARSTLAMLQRMRRELGEVPDDARKAGRSLGSLLGALPGQLRGGVLAGVGVALAALSPLIGATVSAAVIGSVGLGGILGGVAAAAQDPRVKNAASGMVAQIEPEFEMLGRSFVGPVVRSLDILGDTAVGLLQDLKPELAGLAPVTERLTEGVAGLVREVTPGIAAAMREAVPVLDALAQELPGLGRDFRQMFETIASGSDDAEDALRAVINLTGNAVVHLGRFINFLTDAFGLMNRLSDTWVADITPVGAAANFVGQELLGMGDSAGKALIKTTGLSDGLGTTVQAMEDEQEAAILTASTLNEAAEAAGGLSEALRILNGGVLTTREAERNFQEAIDEATAAIEENGRTLDINTAKGRDNQENLDAIADTAIQVADAVLEQTGSQQAANEALQQGRDALIEAAVQMGLTRKEARKLADQLLNIPDHLEIDILTRYRQIGRPPPLPASSFDRRPGPQARAAGGPLRAGELAIVGEEGPELVAFKRNAMVFSNSDSRRMLRAGEPGGVSVGGLPDRFEAVAVIDLGHGITQRIQMEMRRKDRSLKRRAGAGVGVLR